MSLQDFIADQTGKALDGLFKQARFLPADKLEWEPMDQARSALDILQECAVLPKFYVQVLETGKVPEFLPEFLEAYNKSRAELDTLDKAEAACRENTAALLVAIRSVPDAKLADPLQLPWGVWSTAEVLNLHYWNMVYHTGQLCYSQSMLGDKAMH